MVWGMAGVAGVLTRRPVESLPDLMGATEEKLEAREHHVLEEIWRY